MPKITNATPEQWRQVEELRQRIIASQTDQISREQVEKAVAAAWGRMGKKKPEIVICDSPLTALTGSALLRLDQSLYRSLDQSLYRSLDQSLYQSLGRSLDQSLYRSLGRSLYQSLYRSLDQSLYRSLGRSLYQSLYRSLGQSLGRSLGRNPGNRYWAIWWRAWAGWYQGGALLGVNYDADALRDFVAWCEAVPFVAGSLTCICVARNPKQINWQDGLLHCESGPAVEYADGWAHYAINGIALDEQVVMRPDSQTIKQIDGESNADIRAIRIERFGWTRYLKESGAKPVDESKNYVTGCPEALYQTRRGDKRLVVVCPTGRTFAMGVPSEIETCEQAQRWLGPANGNCIAAT